MNKQRAEQVIVISLVVMLASTIGGGLAQGKKGEKYYGKKIVGGFLTMLFSSLAAEVAPEAAALLSVSIATYAFFHYGLPAINGKYKTTGAKQANGETVAPEIIGELI